MAVAEAEVQGDPHVDQEAMMTTTTTMANQRRQSSHPIVQGRHKAQHVTPSKNK